MKFRNPFSRPSETTRANRSETPIGTTSQTSDTAIAQRQDVISTLDLTIQTIQTINDLIPIEIAKSILTGITKVLSLLEQSLRNEGDLMDIRQQCRQICSTLVQATKGYSMDQMPDVLLDALRDLDSSIVNLYLRVEKALQHPVRKFIAANVLAKEITAWSSDLSMTLLVFSARLNIVGSIRLEEACDFIKRKEIPNLIPKPPPPPPAMFFGRESLFAMVKDDLLREKDVVLVGTGGIGKSCIAKALINDEDIKGYYSRRFFVSFNGMDPKTITLGTFIDRIAGVLGLPLFGTESGRQVKANLSSSPVLIVLDNAETFEDAANDDAASQIASFVAEIANTEKVTVILTSRTSDSARNVRWTVVKVPPLERTPARQYFQTIYHDHEISDDDIDTLLDALDFHPLSIHILAYTAVTNQWTGNTLLDRWNKQKSGLLWRGRKKENLAFTIALSLDSPSIKALGDQVLHVLWIISFLPQGINEKHVERLFPSIPNIPSLMDTLRRMSLIYRSASFLTTLAPIRLYFLDTFPSAGLGLLGDIRDMYYSSLEEISKERDSHADLLISDHTNIEHILAFGFSDSLDDMEYPSNIYQCYRFLSGLADHKLRPTLLGPILSSLSETSALVQMWKAYCLRKLGVLYYRLANFSSARKFNLAAAALFGVIEDHSMAAFCVSAAALSYVSQGRYLQVQQLLEDLLSTSTWQDISKDDQEEVYYILDKSRMHMSSECLDQLFLRSMHSSHRSPDPHVHHWMARMYHGYNLPAEVEKELEEIRPVCLSSEDAWVRWRFLQCLAEVMLPQGKLEVVTSLIDKALDTAHGDLRLTLIALKHKAALASVLGNYELARSLLQYSIDTLDVVATPSSRDFLWMLYVQGRNEMYAEDYSHAHRLFSDVVANCEVCDELKVKTFCVRALGEVEVLLGHEADSDRYFAQTVELCKEAGVPPELLGICEPLIKLDDDKYPGWKRYLRENCTTTN